MTDAAELVKLADATQIVHEARQVYENHKGDGAWIAMEQFYVQAIGAAMRYAAAQQDGAWQPIETAPKDGTHILAAWADTWPKNPHAEAMYFADGGWWYAYDGDGHSRPPTHWMPLPAPQRL